MRLEVATGAVQVVLVVHRADDAETIGGFVLMGEPELCYTYGAEFGGVRHYVINFNEPAPQPVKSIRCSADAERLSEDEILNIINNPPEGI